MRRAASACHCSSVVGVVGAALVSLLLSLVIWAAGPVSQVYAAEETLSVGVDRPLSLVGDPLALKIEGDLSGPLQGLQLVLHIKGPCQSAQVGRPAPELPEDGTAVCVLEDALEEVELEMASGSESGAAPSSVILALGADTDLAGGVLRAQLRLPAGMPGGPGAYLLVLEVRSSGAVIASGQAWIGKVAPREGPVDLAVVWPVSLGIHRDPEGVFFDSVLEEAVSPDGETARSLRVLLSLSDRFPDWRFTLAVEPVLLAQLRDMADGYTRLDASGAKIVVGPSDAGAVNAAAMLTAFRALAEGDSVEFVVSPYSGADLGLLAAEGWRDGLEHILMAKQELQQSLALESPPVGGCPPDLDLTAGSLAYYAGASIDHVVVTAGLADCLAEPIAPGTVAVRAQDAANNRVTLMFASSGVGAQMAAPWDGQLFAAALAADLASDYKDAVVAAPDLEFAVVPGAYLEAIGQILQDATWLRTQTLGSLLSLHRPDTRPLYLAAAEVGPQRYIEEALLDELRQAHAPVSALGAGADLAPSPVQTAYYLLYMAESRWWYRSSVSPEEAGIGLRYAQKARMLAEGELDKVSLISSEPSVIIGSKGAVKLVLQNDADYPFTVQLRLEGGGAAPAGEGLLEVKLEPGRTEVPLRVVRQPGRPTLEAAVLVGDIVVDQEELSLRFVSTTAILLGSIVGVLVIGGGVYLVVRRRAHKPARAAAKRGVGPS